MTETHLQKQLRAVKHFLHLLVVAAGIYISYITYGYVQEWMYHYKSPSGEKFTYTNTLLLVQSLGNFFCIFTLYLFSKKTSTPVTAYAVPGLTFILAMLFSNESLQYVSYPTQALAKSCKMVPILISETLFYRKPHGLREFAFVGFVTFGIVLFRSNSSEKEEHDTGFGLVLLALSLLMDGLTSPKQEELRHKYKPSVYEAMLFSNIWALLVLFALLFLTGEGLNGLHYVLAPENLTFLQSLLIFSACSACGQLIIFYAIHEFGALMCSTITTTRKFFTVLVSIFSFQHQMSTIQWVAIAMVFVGLGIELRGEYLKKYHQKHEHDHHPHAEAEKKTL